MDPRLHLALLVLASLLACTTATAIHGNQESSSRSTYIVHVRPPTNFSTHMSSTNLETWYRSFLPPLVSTPGSDIPFIHTYREAILGFAVNLTKNEVEYVAKRDGVLMVYEDYLIPLLTTHTPDFLGLRSNGGVWSRTGMGEGIIIGVLDTGIDASHISFDDEGMKPPPAKWRGSCNFGGRVKCNKKFIGGRPLYGGSYPPWDSVGHGTHCASTAAGRSVQGASVPGKGNGTAAGMAPRAHIAMYQVCNRFGCFASDMIAGMDAAIRDGVDILSISLGSKSMPFHLDTLAIGAFSALRKGIFVSCAAGNSGPLPRSTENEAPWILTVGACRMDRGMEEIVKLGTPSPVVARFSSRGPSTQTPGILKPDIISPGVDIIAAWPFKVRPGQKNMAFNTLSGTSMATPHLSGIAAIIKSAHPDWSPAAIKSAIMTTAYVVDANKKPILDERLNPAGLFSIGAGLVNPSQAVNPGLIYDTDEEQYISYLCGLGYTSSQVERITKRIGACGRGRKITEAELNYPSIAVTARIGKIVVKRTVTNVGDATSSYTVNIEMPKEVRASVSPSKLQFTRANEKKTFTVSLTWDASRTMHAEGNMKWVSNKHVVRSPIVIF
ncbi:unnamed protein product [Urochloa humidicola]